MTGAAEDIADRIVALGIATLTPPNIFTGEMPPTPDDAISVKELPGGASIRAMGKIIADEPDVQVVVRRKQYASLVSTVLAIMGDGVGSAVDGWKGTIDGHEYLFVTLVNQPLYLGKDENNRRETSLTFRCTKRR